MLKLIPRENPDPKKVAKKIANSVKRAITKKPYADTPKLRQKFEAQIKKEQNILAIVSIKLARFIKKHRKPSDQEVNDLIYSLQKSVLSLQRHKQLLLREKNRKNNKRE